MPNQLSGCRKFPAWCQRSAICLAVARSRRAARSLPRSAGASVPATKRRVLVTGPPAGTPISWRGRLMPDAAAPVLQVDGLEKHFSVRKGLLRRVAGLVYAVNDISFTI